MGQCCQMRINSEFFPVMPILILAREIAAYLGTTVGDAVINRFNNG